MIMRLATLFVGAFLDDDADVACNATESRADTG